MILSISTSSSLVSLALFSRSELIASVEKEAPRAAASTALALLEGLLASTRMVLNDFDGFVADVGPGSFTGVRVGVTLVKTLGYAFDKRVGGVLSFSLIADDAQVAVPIKRGQWAFRDATGISLIDTNPGEGVLGYGHGFAEEQLPSAARLREADISWCKAEELLPFYGAEPAISTPKDPSRVLGGQR